MKTSGLSIIIARGQAENFISLGVLTYTAANLGVPVKVFVTGLAVPYFTKNKPELRPSKEFEDYAKKMFEGMEKLKSPSWYDMLKEAKEVGEVKIYGCSMTAEALGVKREDWDPLVDEIVGATFFLTQTKGDTVIYI
ncbi:DsrE/DsrF/DrsH-like family protein [Fervidicoccus fontis]|uniref:DsrE/DsrF/DrsH-like family protein n=1 Tax=Fervidicoccus fontis TaxID=683846 RepID=A0A843AIB2_9CREN|nr:DsrE/DsrF/DrsH-like family protein [Fervidicoccus fontis]MBE9391210.1 DsrE/DsrF/DrsH-like family protein [Fervidicoccus fontis]PMB77172.1 MAG: peroxiredoxin [Fervidicoccus fontis]